MYGDLSCRLDRFNWLGLWETPASVQDFGARAIKPHDIIPPPGDRQAIRCFAVTAAKLDGDRAIRALLGGNAVQVVSVLWIGWEKPLSVVNGDGPEGVDWHIVDSNRVDSFPIVLRRSQIEIDSVLVRIASPGGSSGD